MNKSKKYRIVAIVVAAVMVYATVAVATDFFLNVQSTNTNTQFLSARNTMASNNNFDYNFTLKQYFNYTVTLPNIGAIQIAVMNGNNAILPGDMVNVTKQSTTGESFPAPVLTFVILGKSIPSTSRIGFTVTHESLSSSNFTLPAITTYHISGRSLSEVKAVPGSGPSYEFTGSLKAINLSSVPSGHYRLHVTLEFYFMSAAFPIPVKSYSLSLPFEDISWKK